MPAAPMAWPEGLPGTGKQVGVSREKWRGQGKGTAGEFSPGPVSQVMGYCSM